MNTTRIRLSVLVEISHANPEGLSDRVAADIAMTAIESLDGFVDRRPGFDYLGHCPQVRIVEVGVD